jgi:carbonic anhydrase
MDARIDPAAAFGIDLGDAHVIRNAGGSARDAIRSIVISEQLLGTKEVLLVKHTGTQTSSTLIPASIHA